MGLIQESSAVVEFAGVQNQIQNYRGLGRGWGRLNPSVGIIRAEIKEVATRALANEDVVIAEHGVDVVNENALDEGGFVLAAGAAQEVKGHFRELK